MRQLTDVINQRFDDYLAMLPGRTPPHRVEFSRRITTSWALIYYRRHLVRLSPYLFLLEPHELQHRSHWEELDATLRHEAVHANVYARTGQAGHTAEFHRTLAGLGVEANGGCDLGPENAAYRYVYACPSCSRLLHRRGPLKGNWSCGACAPGQYDARYQILLLADLGHPWTRLRLRRDLIGEAVREARARPPTEAPLRRAPVHKTTLPAVAMPLSPRFPARSPA